MSFRRVACKYQFFALITAIFTGNMYNCTDVRTCRSAGAGPGVTGMAPATAGGDCAAAGGGGPVRLATER